MPIPSARPPSDMMLSDTPARFSGAKVHSTEIGIDTATITVDLEVPQEQEQHEHRQDPAGERGVAHLVDARLDEQRAVRDQPQLRAVTL
jgi:hypothetical protein